MKKVQDLKIPFSWQERRAVFLEKFFYLPPACKISLEEQKKWQESIGDFRWSDPRLFGNDLPVILEYCSGNGQWICQKAKENPDYNWVALDIRFDRCKKIWARLIREKIPNLFVFCGEARILTSSYLPKRSLDGFYVNFPDPWPKLRHAKHRLIQSPFIEEAAELLLPQKEAILVTDDFVYLEQMIQELQKSPKWKALLPFPHYELNPKDLGSSFFLELWQQKKRNIHQTRFQVCHEIDPSSLLFSK